MLLKYKKAQSQLRYALQRQKTISTNKLSRILQAMNISLNEDNRNKEVDFLKERIKEYERRLQVVGQQLHNQKIKNKRLRKRSEKHDQTRDVHRV